MKPPPPYLTEIPISARIVDLFAWYELYGYCCCCGHIGAVDRTMLIRKYGTHTYFVDLHRRMRCKTCTAKGDAQFGITKMPR
ncbi:hypothetical protein GGQ79_003835 [Ochrobactrum pecoris]|uniref:Transposase n=1 Tax=Brucella pecoris TaxID=867683 RepID=A0AB34YW35_9HYPH|nr:hypothetical protein [Brucella pecoris]